MKKIFLFLLSALAIGAYAETFTIVFNSNEGGDGSAPKTPKISDFIYTATNNCVYDLVYTNKVARAKAGFGIKGGTASEKGEICFRLDDTYQITAMTIYTACYDNSADKSKNYGIDVCGKHITWDKEHITDIYAYSLPIGTSLNTDSISIAAANAKNNRWYVQKIEFEAENPHPEQACIEMQYPDMDFGSVSWIGPEDSLEDVLNLNIAGKNVVGNISLSLKSGAKFSLGEATLPSAGGEVDIFYSILIPDSVKTAIPYSDILTAKAKGADGVERSQSLNLKLTVTKPSSGASSMNLDTTCMAIGPMPSDYYHFAQHTADSTLKNHLGAIICCGKRYKYGSGQYKSWDAFFHTDRDTVTNQVLDMYSNNIRYFNPDKPTASVADFDIEHMMPKSWWGGTVNPAYCDIYHLVPGDYSANRSKSNHAPGIPTDTTFWNGSFATGDTDIPGLDKVFCPADEYKGDFARAYFYIATCYGDSLTWVTTGEPGVSMTNEGWQEFRPWLRDLLLDWHRKDPVSKKELDRAIEVNKIQGNRNPFIDYPELVEYIWGNKQGVEVDFYQLTQSYGDPYDDTHQAVIVPQAQETAARKEFRDGQIVILRNASIYSILGQTIR